MEYCKRCLYPANARPTIILDDEGVCSGCRYHETRQKIDWSERRRYLDDLLGEYRAKQREKGNPFDCIIPVSGGKDSHFQAHVIKQEYGLNPLLVTYNHAFNTRLGIRNLSNIVEKLGIDLVRYTTNPHTVKKISRYMIERVGDLTWHYHAGIRTFPFQMSVKYDVPLVILGEHGFAELVGMVTLEDMVEHTNWTRQEMDMRGVEIDEVINEVSGVTPQEVAPFVYPREEEIDRVGVRGIYMSNFFDWDAKKQAEQMIEKYDFGTYTSKRDRTFVLAAKTDDHANDVHDYMKYLKFGYGRATDDASTEIRHGRMTREEGIEMVKKYDANRPRTLDAYLDYLGLTEEQFYSFVDDMRDEEIWERGAAGGWQVTDSVANHADDDGVEAVRVPLVPEEERTFSAKNSRLYYSERHWENEGGAQVDRRREFHENDLLPITL